MKKFLFIILAFLVITPNSFSFYENKKLNEVGSWIALRNVKVRCYEQEEKNSPSSFMAWGYVNKPLSKQKYMHLDQDLCEGALDINNTSIEKWKRGIGVLILTHEAYHLRRWGGADNEGLVECQAIRHWKYVARKLGATEETIKDLWGTGLAAHYELTQIISFNTGEKTYYYEECIVPPLITEYP